MYSSLLILIIKWTNEWPMAAGDKQLEYLMRNNSQTHFSIHSLTNLDMKKKIIKIKDGLTEMIFYMFIKQNIKYE